MTNKNSKPTFIDLFAGAGGLSIGFEKAGFKLVAATDWDHWSCETLRANHPDIVVHEGDIADVNLVNLSNEIAVGQIDLIVGGPPCQGFSQLGKRQEDDPRNQMWRQYMRFVEHFKPKVFLIENVPQILKSGEFESIKKTAESLGYIVREKVLHAADYGVPQKRKRAIILGSRIGEPWHPTPTHSEGNQLSLDSIGKKPWKTVKEAFAGLPLKPNDENWHIGRNPTEMSLKRYRSIPIGGNRFNLPLELTPDCWKRKKTGSTDVFGRLSWDKPSLTIRTEFFKPEKGRYLHPEEHRPITIREAARLQTFPDEYKIIGSYTQAAKQIGNAVPSELARNIGIAIIELLDSASDDLDKNFIYGSTSAQRKLAQLTPQVVR